MFFKVVLSIENIPVHVRSIDSVQMVVRSSCLIFNASPTSTDGSDMS
jgi:hypothetical protein